MNRAKPEILAPAGSIEGLKAAIAAGCDAVYIGGSRFGARAYAKNPEKDEMLEAIAYCHLHGVKIYMTVNTVLKNREIKEALFDYLCPYYEAGLDAVIVQDMGVLRFISRHFPKLDIHASTQMTLTMGRGKEFLEKYHINRIVPARELTLKELSCMRKETQMELEVFVHGALCYCYSGQCLFSSMLGGRSGNRGRCAQPCRLPYHFLANEKEKDSYLISPKELCNLSAIGEMIEAGIDSFKIEGRMKRAEYTAFVTAMYRKYVDLYGELGKERYHQYLKEHEKEWQQDLQNLADIYNRQGFTKGYLEGKAGDSSQRQAGQKGQMLAQKRPKHGGVYVGKVTKVNKHEVVYTALKDIGAQDVVEFRDDALNPTYEYTLGEAVASGTQVTARYKKGSHIKEGDGVFRTKNAKLLEEIRTKYLEGSNQLAVKGKCIAKKGQPLLLHLTMGEHQISYQGDICQEAKKQAVCAKDVEVILKKTGTSRFFFEKLSTEVEEGIFLPVGAIKKMRREAFEGLYEQILKKSYRNDTIPFMMTDKLAVEEERGKNAPVSEVNVEKNREEYGVSASVMLFSQVKAVCDSPMVKRIYLGTETMNAEEIAKAYLMARKTGKDVWLAMPFVFRKAVWELFEKEYIQEGALFGITFDGYLVRNTESFAFLRSVLQVDTNKIRMDSNMYVMNDEACLFWKEQGVDRFSVPLEATKREMDELSYRNDMEACIYGKVPLMLSAQCMMANHFGCSFANDKKHQQELVFSDQKNRRFLCVNYCKYCYNIIYQESPCYLPEFLEDVQKGRRGNVRFSFTTENAKEVTDVLAGKISVKTHRGHFDVGIE